MNPPKFTEDDYISFSAAGPKIFTCNEAERVLSVQENAPSHDSVSRLLHRLKASAAEDLRNGAPPFAGLKNGVPIPDGSASDKLYSQHIEPVCRHRSGKHRSVVKGINLLTLPRTDGDAHIPCDYRIYSETRDGKTGNGRFSDLLYKAGIRGFEPSCVLSDSRYAGLDNLKIIRTYGRHRLTRFKPGRPVNPDGKGDVPLSPAAVSETGTAVHLKGYGFIRIFRTAVKNGGTE